MTRPNSKAIIVVLLVLFVWRRVRWCSTTCTTRTARSQSN